MNKWIDLDDQAVAISRALAMDAVQKLAMAIQALLWH